MLIGQYIMRLSGLDQFSPPVARGGQSALLGINVLDVPGGGAQLVVDVEHKNDGDTTWQILGSFTAITTTGIKTLAVSGAKEQLRFNFSVAAGASPEPYDAFYISVLAPTWDP
jgi:hypothetical protein